MKIPKPQSCNGCPLHSAGGYMVPDEVVPGSRVYVHTDDASNELLDTVFFPLAQLIRGEHVSIGQTIRCAGGDVLNPAAYREAVVHCTRAHSRPPSTVELVIAQGDGAWGYYIGVPLGDWRGFLAPRNHEGGPQIYGVLSFSEPSLKRQPHLTLPSKLDWARIPRILNGELPVPFPPRLVVGVDDHNEVCKWFADARRDAEYLQWDTEYFYDVDDSYNPTNHDLTRLS